MPDGIYTALVTPFADGKVDRKAWRAPGRSGRSTAGVAGIVPGGLHRRGRHPEPRGARVAGARRPWRCAAGKCAVVAGSGTNSTETTIAQTRDVKAWGADAAMLISPYYNKPQQHGLLAHYRAVARAVDIPIVLYNVPGRTAVNILPETAAQLAAEPNIVALKEASGNLAQIEEAIARCDLKVFSGDDGLNFQIFGLGGRGAISVVSNLLPGAMVRFWQAWAAGDINQAWPHEPRLRPGHPAPASSRAIRCRSRSCCSLAGICRRDPRLPLVPVTEQSLTFLVQFYESTLADLMARDLEAPGVIAGRRPRRRGAHGPAGDRAGGRGRRSASWPAWSPSRAGRAAKGTLHPALPLVGQDRLAEALPAGCVIVDFSLAPALDGLLDRRPRARRAPGDRHHRLRRASAGRAWPPTPPSARWSTRPTSASACRPCSMLLQLLARTLPRGFDAEQIETHHVTKLDRPSGTARALAAAWQQVRGGAEPPTHSLRVGGVIGEHTWTFATRRRPWC